MATEEEAREATDGQEVQVEAANDLQAQFDSKLSSIKEIKGEAQTMDSTEGILKISEDEVLVEAPSETKIPSEHSLNGMTSSLNGHVDKEENISNEQPHEINQESQEQLMEQVLTRAIKAMKKRLAMERVHQKIPPFSNVRMQRPRTMANKISKVI
uniref:Uncharacterized protein n=1 Tax=Oryza punctata TaxID=4537 RepID=A0A0E0JV51_ORYPU